MNSNTTDEKIRARIAEIDSLQAGIVYGKEEAWDKLQARMETRPRRKVVLLYRLAAVAAAMVFVVVLAIRYSGHEELNTVTRSSEQATVITHPAMTVVQDDHAMQVEVKQPVVQHTRTSPVISSPAPIVPESPRETLPVTALTPQDTVAALAATVKPKAAMPVVHINELYAEPRPQYTYRDSNPFPHVQFRMKIVHINELGRPLRDEDYMKDIDKYTVQHTPLLRRDNSRQGNEPTQLFRINLSQN